MTNSTVEVNSLLAIDVGTVKTRAILFGTVEGSFRFLAVGMAPTTVGPPLYDVSEGVRRAIDQLQAVSGREFFDVDEGLLTPTYLNGTGVDAVVATISVGAPLKVVAVGLLEDISLESARRLVNTTYARLVDVISINDRRKNVERSEAILRHRPDVIVIAGGTENGASKSLMNLVESVGLACYLMPEQESPHIVFAGNQSIAEEVGSSLNQFAPVQIVPNIRPTQEYIQLHPAQVKMKEVFREIRTRENHGMRELDSWTAGRLTSSAESFGRVIRFLSKVYEPGKGVLGIDLGASTTVVSAAFAGELHHNVYPHLGIGAPVSTLLSLNYTSVSKIFRWLSVKASESDVRDYVYHKSVYPSSLPATDKEMDIEHALAREVLRVAIRDARKHFPAGIAASKLGSLPWFEPIVASGSVLTQAPSHGEILLMLLDALEPTGITTFVLDQNNLVPMLGAAAEISPLLTVQVLESGALLNLGTVISPVGNARSGTSVLRVRVSYESKDEITLEVKQGELVTIQLPAGEVAHLRLQSLHGYDVGMGGRGRSGNLRVVGGALGVVVDARGRPLQLLPETSRRRAQFMKWLRVLNS